MSNMLVGVEGIARKVKAMYIGVDGVARKVKKGYVGVDGVARQFYAGEAFGGYTGAYTTSTVTIDGAEYTLYTLTGSGTLTLNTDAKYWMCGGGAKGREGDASGPIYASGAGGAGAKTATGTAVAGEYVVTIGAQQGATSMVGTTTYKTATVNSASGGSGGGTGVGGNSGGYGYAGDNGTGDGGSKYPFGLSALYAHCAGGNGGGKAIYYGNSIIAYGGKGGSNGADGDKYMASSGTSVSNPSSAIKGGGRAASNASFYGSGGGGANVYTKGNSSNSAAHCSSPGSGYQGVLYIAIPAA